MLSSFKNTAEKLDKRRALYLSAKNQSNKFEIDFTKVLIQNVQANVNNTFTEIINNFITFSKKLDTENKQLLADKVSLFFYKIRLRRKEVQ